MSKKKEKRLRVIDDLLQSEYFTKKEIQERLVAADNDDITSSGKLRNDVSIRTIEKYISQINSGECWPEELFSHFDPEDDVIIKRNRPGLETKQTYGYEKEYKYNTQKYPGFKLFTNRLGKEIRERLITFIEMFSSIDGLNQEDEQLIQDIASIVENEGHEVNTQKEQTIKIYSNLLYSGSEFDNDVNPYIIKCREAIEKNQALRIKYKPFYDQASSMLIDDISILTAHPYKIIESNNRWFLIAYIEKANDKSVFIENDRIEKINTLGIERIHHLKILYDHPYENRKNHVNKKLDMSVGPSIPWDDIETEDVILETHEELTRYFKSKPLHETQQPLENNRFLYPKLIVTRELEQKILSYGEKIKVIESKDLQKKILKRISEMKKRYKS